MADKEIVTDADKLAQMLLETISVLEAHNFMELLPIEAAAWYESRRAAELDAEESNKTEALKFLERKVGHLQRISSLE